MSATNLSLFLTGIVVFCGVIGLLAVISPRAFAAVVTRGNQILSFGRERNTDQRWLDIDKYVLEHGRLFGVIVCCTAVYLWWISNHGPDVYSKSILLPIVGVALVMGILALRHIMWQQHMLETQVAEANRDSLTGLANRRAFEFELNRRLTERQRRGRFFSVAIIDIDKFKSINDRHGHLVGDAILEEAAAAMCDSVDESSLVARLGGDEFAVIFHGSDIADASLAEERLQAAVCKVSVPHEETLVTTTVSIGLAEAESDDDVTSLLKRADTALYAAKDAGRNCCYRQGGPEPAVPAVCGQPA